MKGFFYNYCVDSGAVSTAKFLNNYLIKKNLMLLYDLKDINEKDNHEFDWSNRMN